MYRNNIQSILEKMVNMTKELAKRDTLLEKAKVWAKEAEKLVEQLSQVDVINMEIAHSSELAPAVSQVHSKNDLDIASITSLLLRNSPLLPYNNPADDKIYMGNSGLDRQERRNRKVVKKGEKKRNNQQREKNSNDSDVTIKSVEDRMVKQGVDCDDDNSDNKRKRKAVKKGKAPQREENSNGNLIIGSDKDMTVEEVLDFDEDEEDYEVVDTDMASPLN